MQTVVHDLWYMEGYTIGQEVKIMPNVFRVSDSRIIF